MSVIKYKFLKMPKALVEILYQILELCTSDVIDFIMKKFVENFEKIVIVKKKLLMWKLYEKSNKLGQIWRVNEHYPHFFQKYNNKNMQWWL